MSDLDPGLDPHLAGLLSLMADGTPMHATTPVDARRMFRTLTVDMRDPTSLPEVASVKQIRVPGGDSDLDARVYRPREGLLPTVLLFHGGGWVIGDLDTHDLAARTIATLCDAVVVSVAYRLAPEHPYPAAVHDAVAATRWASAHLDDLGGSEVLALAGDSAGGNLAAVVAQVLRDEGVRIGGQLLLYPGTDMLADSGSRHDNAEGYFLDQATMLWFAGHYLSGGGDPSHPSLSPINGDLAGVAPAVVVVAEFDPLRDEGVAYARALEAAGVSVRLRSFDGLIHGFVDMGRFSPTAQAAIEETCALFREILHPR